MTKTVCDLLINNAQIVSMDASRTVYSRGAVAINGQRIAAVGEAEVIAGGVEPKEILDAKGGIVHPGFIDAHNHIVHSTCRGVFRHLHDIDAATIKFADWKTEVSDEDEAAAITMAGLEMLRGGFTMFIEPGSLFSTTAAAQAVERVGIRALFSPLYLWDRLEPFEAIPSLISDTLMARAPIDHRRSMDAIDQELYRNANPDEALVRGYIFIYGEGTGSPELLKAAKACADEHNVPLHLHAGYVPKGAEIYQAMTGTSQIEHLMSLGVLDSNTVLVHANFVNDAEEQAIRDSGCQIIWCPVAFFSLGVSNVASFKMTQRYRNGTAVALAADGAFDAPSSECMRAARFLSQTYAQQLSPGELLEMQTINAARAAGMEGEIGSIEVGKRADLVVRDALAAEAYPGNNPVHALALNLGQGSVRSVLVNGRKVFDNGASTQVDEKEVLATVSSSVRARAARLSYDLDVEWPVVG